MLEVKNVSVTLGDFSLEDLSLSVQAGEYVVVLGMSGVGKTVLLEILAGLTKPNQGQLFLAGEEITHTKIQHRPIRLVYQDQALFPHLSVGKNLGYGLRCQKENRQAISSKVEQIAGQLGIEHLLERMPDTLSGGESQRVALGRALVTQPKVLLLDEPLSALDPHSRSTLQALLRTLHRQGQTIIHVTHDYEEALSLATRVIVLEKGAIVQQGNPEEIFMQPQSAFVARFIGIRNVLDGQLNAASEGSHKPALFTCHRTNLEILTQEKSGSGFCVIPGEHITLAVSEDTETSGNRLLGEVMEIIPAVSGVEVVVYAGIQISVLVTSGAVGQLDLKIGKKVYLSFAADAVHYIPNPQ